LIQSLCLHLFFHHHIMTLSRYPQITDELLSAYIDSAVTENERGLIETAIAGNPEVAWRLETLRHTIRLLRELPQLSLPRSFVLQESDLLEASIPGGQYTPPENSPSTPAVSPSLWPLPRLSRVTEDIGLAWRAFWQTGNLFLRNAAAASLALFLVLLSANLFLGRPPATTLFSEAAPAAPPSLALQAPASAAGETTAGNTAATPQIESADEKSVAAQDMEDAMPLEADTPESPPAAGEEPAAVTLAPAPFMAPGMGARATAGESGEAMARAADQPLDAPFPSEEALRGGEQTQPFQPPPMAQAQAEAALAPPSEAPAANAAPPARVDAAETTILKTETPETPGIQRTPTQSSPEVAAVEPAPTATAASTTPAASPLAADESRFSSAGKASPFYLTVFSRFQFLQLGAALLTLTLSALWWRSRSPRGRPE
jgi:anti-sigma factor RsiW